MLLCVLQHVYIEQHGRMQLQKPWEIWIQNCVEVCNRNFRHFFRYQWRCRCCVDATDIQHSSYSILQMIARDNLPIYTLFVWRYFFLLPILYISAIFAAEINIKCITTFACVLFITITTISIPICQHVYIVHTFFAPPSQVSDALQAEHQEYTQADTRWDNM